MIKKTIKRAFLMLLSVMTLCVANAETVVTVDGLKYSLSGAYASVYGVASGNTSESISVPATINFEGLIYTVNAVGMNCFRSGNGASYVKEVILPNSIKTIGEWAFYNSNISNVSLQEGVRSIEHEAFCYSGITELIIPSTVQSLASTAFNICNKLRTLIYLSSTAPSNWTATSFTYLPSKYAYNSPAKSINNASVFAMISFSEDTFTYTGKAPTPTWRSNMEGYSVNFSMPTLKSEVGTYTVVIPATFTKGDKSFTAQVPYQYTIQKAKLTAKVSNTSRTYGEPNPDFRFSYSGFVNGDDESVLTTTPTVTTTATATSNAGTYPITISGGEAKNYTIEYEQGELTVNKASLNIQVMDATKVYGTNNPAFSISYSGLKNGETTPVWVTKPEFNTTAIKESNAGDYEISVTCEPKNYSVTSNKSGKLTITQAPLTIKANNVTMDYCGPMPTYSYTYSGFVNGDDETVLTTLPSIATDATPRSDVGSYEITPTGAVAKNYTFTYTPATLTIKQRTLTVKANSARRLYGENNPEFTLNYEGFVNNETKTVLEAEPTASTRATIASNAGTYDIYVGGGRAKNYTFNYQNGQLNIVPRPLKASVGNYERPYGQDNPAFTILYEGLVGNDTEASLSTRPMARTTATRYSNVGTYSIEVTGGYSPNYTLSYGSGKLTIVKADQTFDWNQDLSNLKVGDQIELRANASSNLPVTYTMDSDQYAEIYTAGSRTYMECKSVGSFHVKAVQNGNDNYYPTQRINKIVTISGEGEENLKGDMNGDGVVNVTDVTAIINIILRK